jgi:hypothetical protein
MHHDGLAGLQPSAPEQRQVRCLERSRNAAVSASSKRRRADPHPHLARARLGDGDVRDLEYLTGRTVPGHLQRLHGLHFRRETPSM